ncbi:MAG TPA: 3-phosphoshikimate 1-carboxyvinyltransferase [Terriglobales bacterium]|nr:3-phosphoshikimate 1-carboxyvinyltransferase [Terriglobales bacterium]
MQHGSDTVTIYPARTVEGTIRVPGDKSISHRYAMLGAISDGRTRLTNFSTGADCASTLACVRALGCDATHRDGTVEIEGRGLKLEAPSSALDCGNSGSTMRMMSGILAGQPFSCELIGDESLSRRPMRRVMAPLNAMGAKIDSRDGCPPLQITGAKLSPITYELPVPSAQVKSAVLLAGLYATGETVVVEPIRTRDHTEIALRAFGAEVSRSASRISICGGQTLHGIDAEVPGDLSSAAFFLCAAALFPNSSLVIDGLGMNPTRAVLLDVLASMGAGTKILRLEEHHGELVGLVSLQPGELKGTNISGAVTAAVVDEIPVLAAIAPYTKDGMSIRDAGELRVKESDRLAAVAENLRAMGARVEEHPDGLTIPGGQALHGTDIDSHDDHRIAMAFAVAALRASGETRIHGASCARISFPEFFHLLQQLTSE